MPNKQLDFMFPYQVPEGMHPYAPLLVRPLGIMFDAELINDLCAFLFDMVGVKLHDVEPSVVKYTRGWDDSRTIDETVPGGDQAAVWSPDLPPGLALDPRTGVMRGELPDGQWEWTVHVGPQVKYDAFGGSGSPNEDGRWIGALEDRSAVKPAGGGINVENLTDDQRDELLAALQRHSDKNKEA